MSLHPKDPRLTAYAFGELEGAELAEVEAYLARSAEGRAAVEDLRALSGDLSAAYAADLGGPVPGPVSTWRRYWPVIGGVAAGLALAIWLQVRSSSPVDFGPTSVAHVEAKRSAKLSLNPPPMAKGEFRDVPLDVVGVVTPMGVSALAVKNAVWAHQGDVRGCYTGAGERGAVSIAMTVVIGRGGKVESASMNDGSGGSEAIRSCLVESVRRWDFGDVVGLVSFAVKVGE